MSSTKDLTIEDNEQGVVDGCISDIEFWMYQLDNRVSGYLVLNEYKEQWNKAKDEYEGKRG